MEPHAEDGSVTRWIRELKAGNRASLSKLWERYFETVAKKARVHFGINARIVRDEEDIALSVLGVLCQQAALVDINDRGGLIRLLMLVTKNKVSSEKRVQRANFRGGGRVAVISDLGKLLRERIANQTCDVPTPESLVEMEEQCQLLLEILPDDVYREIVRLRLIGNTIAEIADELDVVPRTIHRKLKIIQKTWIETMEKEDDAVAP